MEVETYRLPKGLLSSPRKKDKTKTGRQRVHFAAEESAEQTQGPHIVINQAPLQQQQPPQQDKGAQSIPFGYIMAFAALVSAAIGLYLYAGSRGKKLAEVEAGAAVEEQGPSEEQIREWEKQEEDKLRYDMIQQKNEITQVIAGLRQQLAQTEEQAKSTKAEFEDKFGTKKISYDQELSDMEAEQSLDTAFMLKDEIDQKKTDMIRTGEQLAERGAQLNKQLEATYARLQALDAKWRATFPDGPPLLPPPPQQATPNQTQ